MLIVDNDTEEHIFVGVVVTTATTAVVAESGRVLAIIVNHDTCDTRHDTLTSHAKPTYILVMSEGPLFRPTMGTKLKDRYEIELT